MVADKLHGQDPRAAPASRTGAHTIPFALLTLCFILVCIPVFVTGTPPLSDYPNHLARAHALARWDEHPFFDLVFDRGSILIPNVLADLLTVGLAGLFDTMTAGQILLLLIVALTLGGIVALNAAIAGRLSAWSLLPALLIYNEPFFWGFLNYVLGLALMLWGCAAWLALDRRNRALQWTVTALFGLLLLLAHLVAFGLFAVAIGILESARAWEHRRHPIQAWAGLVAGGMAFAPATILYLVASPARRLPWEMLFDRYELLFKKLSPFTRILSSGNTTMDIAVLAGLAILVCAAFVRNIVRFEFRIATVAAVFAILVQVLPYGAMGSFYLDSRIAAPSVMLLLCALVPQKTGSRAGPRHGWPMLAILALLLIRSATLSLDWKAADRDYRELATAIGMLPKATLLIPATVTEFQYAEGWFTTRTVWPPHEHAANYATPLRNALVPNIFAKDGQNPLILVPPSDTLRTVAERSVHRVRNDDDLQALLRQSRMIRTGDPVFSGRSVHLILFGVDCGRATKDGMAEPVYCGQRLSVTRILPE